MTKRYVLLIHCRYLIADEIKHIRRRQYEIVF